jgi:hypothetical protein
MAQCGKLSYLIDSSSFSGEFGFTETGCQLAASCEFFVLGALIKLKFGLECNC